MFIDPDRPLIDCYDPKILTLKELHTLAELVRQDAFVWTDPIIIRCASWWCQCCEARWRSWWKDEYKGHQEAIVAVGCFVRDQIYRYLKDELEHDPELRKRVRRQLFVKGKICIKRRVMAQIARDKSIKKVQL